MPCVYICLLAFLFVCFSTSNTLCAVFFFIFFTTAVIKLATGNKSLDSERHTLYKCGIVQCEDRPYIKDSIDFLGVARTGQRNELHLVGVEVKSRL